jgi:3-oxoacyl-[acyl-carrier protein] reductase
MELNLRGRRAVICGSTRGIGRACAQELAELGATCILLARDEARLSDVCEDLSTTHAQSHRYLVADFSEPDAVAAVIREYAATAPPVHILVNNTGGPPGGPLLDADPDAFRAALSGHLICNHILTQALVPGMKDEGYGRIINIISTSVKQPIPGLGVSNTTRGAVASWAKTLAGELGPFGITVNNVLPGATRTGRLDDLIEKKARRLHMTTADIAESMQQAIPARRFAEPGEVACAVAFLASPAAAYINGINLPVDGGRTACL